MKYSNEIIIDLPRERVVKLFDNVDNMYKWQPGLVSFETIEGEPGQNGSKARLKYKMKKREIEMIETITNNSLPDQFTGTYEAKGVFNWIDNRFESIDENRTKWISDNEFKFSGFMKIIGFLMPSAFKKQSYKFMEDFKNFAEKAS